MNALDIIDKIEKLPKHMIPEINDYIDFLLSKYRIKENDKSKFKYDWEGGLSKLKDKYTSVQLQDRSLKVQRP